MNGQTTFRCRLLARLIAAVLLALGPAGLHTAHAAGNAAGYAIEILPVDPPRLAISAPRQPPTGGGPTPAVIVLDLDQGVLAGPAFAADMPAGARFQKLGADSGIVLDTGGVAGWSVFRGRPAKQRSVRLVVANRDLTLPGAGTPAADAAVRVTLPLASAGKPVVVAVRTGADVASLGQPATLTAAVPVARDRVVFRALGEQALTALDVGDRITLSWTVRDCVSARLSGPIDYGNPVETLPRSADGSCSGTRTVVVMGPATFALRAEVPGTPGNGRNLVIERSVAVDVRRLDQFASLLVTPMAVLPGGDVTVRWHIRDLAGGDRRSAVVAWTDVNGNRRLQRLNLVKGETNSGSFTFAVSNRQEGGRSEVVRLQYGVEALERGFDIVRWQQAAGRFGGEPASRGAEGAMRGLAYAAGRLVMCTEKGIWLSPVGQGGGVQGGVGSTSDPFPPFERQPLWETDPLPPPGGPVPAATSGRRDLAGAPCFGVIALNAHEVAAVLRLDTGAGPARPQTHAELVVLRPGQNLAGKPLTLTEDPIATTAANLRNYQMAMIGPRLYIRVLISRAGGGDEGSLVRAFSADLAALATSRETWRQEGLLESSALPGARWRLVDGFGENGAAMLAVGGRDGDLYRFTRLPRPADGTTLDFPLIGRRLDAAMQGRLRDGVLVNVQGVLVALGADLTYNPQTNGWTSGSTGIADLAGAVAAYRGDQEPRLWVVRRDGERLTLAVDGPRLFSRDYFDQAQDTTLGVLSRRTTLRVLAPVELVWRSEPPGRVAAARAGAVTYSCPSAPSGKVTGIEATVEIDHGEQPPTIFGKQGATDVVLRRAEDGSWKSISSDDCVTVTAATGKAVP